MPAYKIAVFVSGGGTNFQSVLDHIHEGKLRSQVILCHSNKEDAYGLKRAEKAGIPTLVTRDDHVLLEALKEKEVDLIVLAGYLRILSKEFLEAISYPIINIHPSLLPKHGGMGMYGIHVHEDVFKDGDKISGATVHFVNSKVDGGEILLQESTAIEDCKSPQEIQEKVLKIEHQLLPKAIGKLESKEGLV